jgi:death-on-curing protein
LNWINLKELVLIHELVINETGGARGIINPIALESVLLRPFSSFEGKELFPDIWSKVAVLVHSLIAFHPFTDGNKRTAFVAAEVILKLNGYRITPAIEHETFFWAIARGEKSIEEIQAWLKKHATRINEIKAL